MKGADFGEWKGAVMKKKSGKGESEYTCDDLFGDDSDLDAAQESLVTDQPGADRLLLKVKIRLVMRVYRISRQEAITRINRQETFKRLMALKREEALKRKAASKGSR